MDQKSKINIIILVKSGILAQNFGNSVLRVNLWTTEATDIKDRNGNYSWLRPFFALSFTFNVEWHGCINSYFVILFLYVLIFYAM